MQRRQRRIRVARGTGVLISVVLVLVGVIAGPASAQGAPNSPTLDTAGPDMGGFFALAALGVLVSLGVAAWKFFALRDMGIRRGMSEQDATTAALFSQDRVTSAMVLKPEVDRTRRPTPRRPAAEPAAEPEETIESRLAKIESLRASGVITDAEATSRRDEILDEI